MPFYATVIFLIAFFAYPVWLTLRDHRETQRIEREREIEKCKKFQKEIDRLSAEDSSA